MASGFAQWGNDLYTGRRSYDIVGRRKIWFTISTVLVILSAIFLIKPGLNPGIEFRGGSEFVVSGVSDTDQQLAIDTVTQISPEEQPKVTTVGSDSLRIQTSTLTEDEVTEVKNALAEAYDVPVTDVTSSFIGPSWGKDISQKAITGILVFLVFAITDARNSAPLANLAPLLVGLLVVGIGMAWGTDAGYAINPARDFGPRLATYFTGYGGAFRDQYGGLYWWIPIVGPLIGGAVGGALYKYGLQRFLPPAEPVVEPARTTA